MKYSRFLSLVIFTFLIISAYSISSAEEGSHSSILKELETQLISYVADKDARIGIAVIVDGKDTVSVNGNRDFPMVSVYKFPQALAVADYCEKNNVSLNDSINILSEEILPDTWSPLREKYGRNDITVSLEELLSFSLQQSDNNACDILFRLIGGPERVDSLMKELAIPDIFVCNTEAEMHDDIYLCYSNRATPIAMANLFDKFYRYEIFSETPITRKIGELMRECNTGSNRLASPFRHENLKLAHKTGTGDKNSQGRWIAINDAGCVFLTEHNFYSIAVFVADSAYSMEETEKIIADISRMVYMKLVGLLTDNQQG